MIKVENGFQSCLNCGLHCAQFLYRERHRVGAFTDKTECEYVIDIGQCKFQLMSQKEYFALLSYSKLLKSRINTAMIHIFPVRNGRHPSLNDIHIRDTRMLWVMPRYSGSICFRNILGEGNPSPKPPTNKESRRWRDSS